MNLSRRGTAVWLLLILVLAAFLRLWQLDSLPPGLYHDEAYNGLDALSLVQGKSFPQFYEGWELYAEDAHGDLPPTPTRWPIFFEGNYGREPLHVYLMGLSIWLFGPTPFSVRLVPALAGVVAVLTTFLAAKAILFTNNPQKEKDAAFIPLIAAFFVAVLYPAIHFSRFGIRPMLFVPMETLTVYFFWRGITQGSKSKLNPSFLLAGLFLGLGLYTYASARLFPLLFMLFVPIWFWRERAALKQYWLNVTLMAGVSLLTALPLLLFFIRYPYFFVFRIAYVANRGTGTVADQPLLTWLNNVGRVVRGLFWQGETHLRHNLPGRPYLDPIQAVLFGGGFVASARTWPNIRHIFLFLWLLIMLLPTILSGDAPHFGRMTGAVPVIAIYIALGLNWLLDVGKRLLISNKQAALNSKTSSYLGIASVLTFILLLASLFFTTRDYFGRYANHPQLETDFYLADWQLGQFAASQSPETALYLSPTQEELATIYFALANPDRLRNYSASGGVLPAGVPNDPALYLLRPTETAVLQSLQSIFPSSRVEDAPNDAFVALRLPETANRQLVENETDESWEAEIKLAGWSAQMVGDQLHVSLAWQAEQQPALNYTAFVHLLGADGRIVAQHDKPPAGYPTGDWRPGEIVLDDFTLTLPPDWAQKDGPLIVQTGFYDLATLTRLGDPFVIIPDFAHFVEP